MAQFMPQDLFNQTATGIAAMNWMTGPEVKLSKAVKTGALKKLNESLQVYLDYYTDDDFLPEAEECADEILVWVRREFKHHNDTTALILAMNEALLKYKPNGKRKPSWPGLGLWFTSARAPVENRKDRCLKDLALYYFNVVGPATIGRYDGRDCTRSSTSTKKIHRHLGAPIVW